MASDTVTLRLEGDVPLADFARAVTNFNALVTALSREIAPEVQIDWTIEDLTGGSGFATAHGAADPMDAVYSVAHGYLTVGRAMQHESPIPYSPAVQQPAVNLRAVLNGRIRAVVFETADNEAAIRTAAPQAVPAPPPRELIAVGAVTGRIQTLTNRGRLRFTLYDLLHDRAVSCYLAPGREDAILGAWGRTALVEGMVRRDPETGRPVSVREIRNITLLPEREQGGYRRARGAVPGPFTVSAEDAIRRVRDA